MTHRARLLYLTFAILLLVGGIQATSFLLKGEPHDLVVQVPAAGCPQARGPLSVKCEVNAIRRANGLRALNTNLRLRAAAQRHADAMVNQHFFSHVSPSGASVQVRVKRSGYLKKARAWNVGENIGYGSGSQATPRAIVQAWMNSPPHRAIILGTSWTDGGAGIANGTPSGGPGKTYVIDVGSRRVPLARSR